MAAESAQWLQVLGAMLSAHLFSQVRLQQSKTRATPVQCKNKFEGSETATASATAQAGLSGPEAGSVAASDASDLPPALVPEAGSSANRGESAKKPEVKVRFAKANKCYGQCADHGGSSVSGAMDVPTDERHPANRGDAPKIFSDEKVQPITNCGPCWAFGSEMPKLSLFFERRTESLKPLISND